MIWYYCYPLVAWLTRPWRAWRPESHWSWRLYYHCAAEAYGWEEYRAGRC
jgi:hypothetical protein